MAALEPPPALIASCIVLSLDCQKPRFKMLFPLFTVSCPCDPVWSWVYRWWPVVPIPALPYPHHLRIHGKRSRVLLAFFLFSTPSPALPLSLLHLFLVFSCYQRRSSSLRTPQSYISILCLGLLAKWRFFICCNGAGTRIKWYGKRPRKAFAT